MGFLLALAWVATLGGFVWLLTRAFKTSPTWGVLVFLFSPVTAVVFALKHWEDARRPFLVYIGSAFAAGILAASMFMSWAAGSPSDAEAPSDNGGQQVALTEEEKAQLKLMEAAVGLLEKIANTEKDHEMVGAMRGYIAYKRTGNSGSRDEAIANLSSLLDRPDLNDGERKNFEIMLKELQQERGPVIASGPDRAASPQAATGPDQDLPKAQPVSMPAGSTVEARGAEATVQHGAPLPPTVASEARSPEPMESSVPQMERSPFKIIKPAQAKDYIGQRVVVVNHAGQEQSSFLTGVSGDMILFENRLNMGTFSFSYQQSEIRSLKVYQ